MTDIRSQKSEILGEVGVYNIVNRLVLGLDIDLNSLDLALDFSLEVGYVFEFQSVLKELEERYM